MKALRYIQALCRNCFSKVWNKQFLIFLFFLLLSTSFWLFQTLNETYEQDYLVPLEMRGVPKNVVITTELPKYLHVRLRDKGVTLLAQYRGKTLPPAYVDYSQYSNATGHVRILTSELLKQVSDRLAPSTQLVSVKPDTLEFYYNYGLHKRVPVRLQGHIRTAAGYYLATTRLSPDSVTVYAAKSLLDTLTGAYTKPVFLNDVDDTIHQRLDIQAVKGAKFIPAGVELSLFTDRLVEKTVQVPVQWVNFPGTKVLRTFPSKVSITFQVGMHMYRSITAADFVLVVKYEDLLNNSTNKCHLSLRTIPAGVRRVRIEPQEVEYVIEEIQ